jgi:hypothetical protein
VLSSSEKQWLPGAASAPEQLARRKMAQLQDIDGCPCTYLSIRSAASAERPACSVLDEVHTSDAENFLETRGAIAGTTKTGRMALV